MSNRLPEIEGFFNLLFSHLISLYPATSAEASPLLPPLIQTIASAPATQSGLKYRMCVFQPAIGDPNDAYVLPLSLD